MNTAFRFILLFIPIFALAAAVVVIEQRRAASAAGTAAGTTEGGTIVPAARAETVAVPVLTPRQRELEAELVRLGEGFDGVVGIAVADASNAAVVGHDMQRRYPQQSVSKLWVAMTALAQVDEGMLDLAEPVVIRREDLTLFHQPIRDIVRRDGAFATDYDDLLERAITRSDNTANDRLLRRVGGADAVQAFLDDRGVEGVRFGTDERTKQSAIAGLTWDQSYSYRRRFYEARDGVPDTIRRQAYEAYLANPIDGATPAGIASALLRLAEGELLSPASTRRLIATLEATRSGPRRLKGGVPPGWSFGHKTGTGQALGHEQSGYNDVGVLRAPDGSVYSLVVMIARTTASVPDRMELMQQVTRATVAFHEAKPAAADPASRSIS